MKLVKSLTGVAMLVASCAAFAQPSVPPQPAAGPTPDADTGNSGIIVSVFDAVRGVSLVQYLGLRMDDLLPTSASGAPEAGLLLDFGKLGGANGSGTSSDRCLWEAGQSRPQTSAGFLRSTAAFYRVKSAFSGASTSRIDSPPFVSWRLLRAFGD